MEDIVVKSKKREYHVKILRKVFERCQTFKLRMNPLKCAFGVSLGKFWGFLVHNRGISVDPAKATATATMKLPAGVGIEEFSWESLIHSKIHPRFSINYFGLRQVT